ncbi:MAG TPA: endonuclease/exonuclease/phosphatase family protein [Mycobacteriales bacterium]|nr:endonuclease/exonuclease/phosphatase family protein [Mycobacteriales bacterium]
MRVVSWNLRSLRDSRVNVVAVVRELAPDVLCLQEAPRFVFPTRQAKRLAADCGLAVATAGFPVGGLAVLIRPDIRVVAGLRIPLPWKVGRHRRGAALAMLEVAGSRVVFGSFHLGLYADERAHHATVLLDRVAALSTPVVLAGDVNESDDGPAWRALAASYVDAWGYAGTGDGRTFSTRRPRRRIDAVFVDRRLTVTSCQVIATDAVAGASDHRPLLAVVDPPDLSVSRHSA